MAELPDEYRRKVVKLVKPELFPDIPDLDKEEFPFWGIGLVFQPSLSYLYGYSPTDRKFIALRVNSFGQLLVAGVSPSTEWNFAKLSVDETGVYHDFGKEYSRILIINDGPNNAYVALNRAATTSDIEIQPGEAIELSILVSSIGAICNSGETATVRVIVTG